MTCPGPWNDGHPKRNSLDMGACVALYLLWSPVWAPLSSHCPGTAPDLTPCFHPVIPQSCPRSDWAQWQTNENQLFHSKITPLDCICHLSPSQRQALSCSWRSGLPVCCSSWVVTATVGSSFPFIAKSHGFGCLWLWEALWGEAGAVLSRTQLL